MLRVVIDTIAKITISKSVHTSDQVQQMHKTLKTKQNIYRSFFEMMCFSCKFNRDIKVACTAHLQRSQQLVLHRHNPKHLHSPFRRYICRV